MERKNHAQQEFLGIERRTVFRNVHAVPQVFASLVCDDPVTTGVRADVNAFIQAEFLQPISSNHRVVHVSISKTSQYEPSRCFSAPKSINNVLS